jgi:hypothetical protein
MSCPYGAACLRRTAKMLSLQPGGFVQLFSRNYYEFIRGGELVCSPPQRLGNFANFLSGNYYGRRGFKRVQQGVFLAAGSCFVLHRAAIWGIDCCSEWGLLHDRTPIMAFYLTRYRDEGAPSARLPRSAPIQAELYHPQQMCFSDEMRFGLWGQARRRSCLDWR